MENVPGSLENKRTGLKQAMSAVVPCGGLLDGANLSLAMEILEGQRARDSFPTLRVSVHHSICSGG